MYSCRADKCCKETSSAENWQLLVGLDRQFIEYNTATTMQPDMVMLSESTKQKWNVPWEEHLDEAFKKIILCLRVLPYGNWLYCICSLLFDQGLQLGISSGRKRGVIQGVTKGAETALRWLCIKRDLDTSQGLVNACVVQWYSQLLRSFEVYPGDIF